jgi:hypothetical protein
MVRAPCPKGAPKVGMMAPLRGAEDPRMMGFRKGSPKTQGKGRKIKKKKIRSLLSLLTASRYLILFLNF